MEHPARSELAAGPAAADQENREFVPAEQRWTRAVYELSPLIASDPGTEGINEITSAALQDDRRAATRIRWDFSAAFRILATVAESPLPPDTFASV